MKSNPDVHTEPFAVIKNHLADPATSWSVVTFGALAEFFHAPDSPIIVTETGESLAVVTPQGAIRIKPHADLRLVPYEGLSSLENAWTQGVLVCLPTAQARLNGRTGIHECGMDDDSLQPEDETALLFDLGLSIAHLDVGIRTADPDLIALLRTNIGRSLFDESSGLLPALKAASPPRVFTTHIARIEAYQEIPAEDGETPLGPHTHLSQKLLQHNRTQAATLPVPDGWVPVLAFYPPNPLRDLSGTLRPFDTDAQADFQALLAAYGPAELTHIKSTFRDAMAVGDGPDKTPTPTTKQARTALRVAIRQYHHTHGPSELLERWRHAFEPQS